jgi:hypothetical protein
MRRILDVWGDNNEGIEGLLNSRSVWYQLVSKGVKITALQGRNFTFYVSVKLGFTR